MKQIFTLTTICLSILAGNQAFADELNLNISQQGPEQPNLAVVQPTELTAAPTQELGLTSDAQLDAAARTETYECALDGSASADKLLASQKASMLQYSRDVSSRELDPYMRSRALDFVDALGYKRITGTLTLEVDRAADQGVARMKYKRPRALNPAQWPWLESIEALPAYRAMRQAVSSRQLSSDHIDHLAQEIDSLMQQRTQLVEEERTLDDSGALYSDKPSHVARIQSMYGRNAINNGSAYMQTDLGTVRLGQSPDKSSVERIQMSCSRR